MFLYCSRDLIAPRLARVIFLTLGLLSGLRVAAFWQSESLPPIDRRESLQVGVRVSRPAGQPAAERRLRAQLPSVRIDYDPIRQTPSYIRCLDGCLTGPEGLGKAVSPLSLQALAADDPYRAVKGFLSEHADLYGHGSEVLAEQMPLRDDVGLRNGLRTVVWAQRSHGIPVFESVLIGHLTRNRELLALSSTFLPGVEELTQRWDPRGLALLANPPVSVLRAIRTAAESLGEPVEIGEILSLQLQPQGAQLGQRFQTRQFPGSIVASLAWLPMKRDGVALCWNIELTRSAGGERYRVLVDARSGELLVRQCQTLYLQDATYLVYTNRSPAPLAPTYSLPTTRQPPFVSRSRVTLSALDTNASPLGWIAAGENEIRGNNVDAHLDRNADDFPDLPRPHGNPLRVFDFPIDPLKPAENFGSSAAVQLFYWCNVMHDRLYELGFTESAGNFQKDNLGRGGIGGDSMLADAQDGSGVNNANFSPTPDGEPGRIQMFLFNGSDPTRDGDLDAEIILHEYTHGLSTRLVGGGAGISTLQSSGMGEGWSDFYALAILSTEAEDPDACQAIGGYVTRLFFGLEENYYFGIRRYPYSTDLSKNPLTFKDIDSAQASDYPGIPRNPVFPFTPGLASEVHNQGEIWCVTLWEARSRLIRKHGYRVGNELILQLVTDGMKLSPVNPNFLQARDAILQADLVNNGGENLPELWAAFARRGMGFSAISPLSSTTLGVVEAFDLPDPLGVEAPSVLVFSGAVGGPFFQNCQGLVITNQSDSAIPWGTGNSEDWIEISPSRGVLAPRSTATLQVCLTSNALSLTQGRYLDLLRVTNETTGIVQSRSLDARVMQFTVLPFADDFEESELKSQWLVSNPSHGRVQITSIGGPHGGKTHLLMDSNSEGLPARNEVTLGVDMRGWTNVQLRFWARDFNDEPNPPPPSPFRDGADFDGVSISLDGQGWYEVQSLRQLTATNQELVVNLDAPVLRYGLFYGQHFMIRFTQFDNYSVPLDGIALDDLTLEGNPARRFGIELPQEAVEGDAVDSIGTVVLREAALRDIFFDITTDHPEQITSLTRAVVKSGATRGEFSFRVADNSLLDGTRLVAFLAQADGYFGDPGFLRVDDDEIAALTLFAPTEVNESDGVLSNGGRVQVSRQAANDLTIGLRSSNLKKLQVPAEVVIPRGETSAFFDITVVNGQDLDGITQTRLFAEVPRWSSGEANVRVSDDEQPTLSFVLPTAVSEVNAPLGGIILLGGAVPTNVVVHLISDFPDRIRVTDSVTVKAGELTAGFMLAPVNDPLVQGTRSIAFRATATGFFEGAGSLTLLDDETPQLVYEPSPADGISNRPPRLSLAWRPGFGEILINGNFEAGNLNGWHVASESAQGFVLNDGDVNPDGPDSPGPAYEGDFSALLAQDAPGKHRMWQEVTLPSEGISATLSWVDTIHNHGPEFFNPSQQYRVEIQNSLGEMLEIAYTTTSQDPLFSDWTAHTFDLTQYRGQTVRIAFVEQDELGFINVGIDNVSLLLGAGSDTMFEVYLGVTPILQATHRVAITDEPELFIANLSPDTVYYWQVIATHGLARRAGPIWNFTTRGVGGLDHFEWALDRDSASYGSPFPVSLKARSEFGFLVTNFNATVDLKAVAGPQSVDTLLITEVDPGKEDLAEFGNVSGGAVDIGAWRFYFYDQSRWPAPKGVFVAPSNTVIRAGESFLIREGGKAPGVYPDFRLGTNVNWGFLSVGQPVAVLVVDAEGFFVDFMCAVDADPVLISRPMVLPSEAWLGAPLPPITQESNSWQRVGLRNHHSNLDWRIASRSLGTVNSGLQLPFEPVDAFNVNPSQLVGFSNGVWVGSLLLSGVAPALTLRASDGEGHVGISPLFSLSAADDLGLFLANRPSSVLVDEEFAMEFIVTNSGPAALTNVILTDTFGTGLVLAGFRSSAGNCRNFEGGVRCELPFLLSGGSALIQLRFTAAEVGTYTNECHVDVPSGDTFPGNNQRQDAIDVTLPLLVVQDTSVLEGNSGTNFASFRVKLSRPIQREVRVHYVSADLGATAGLDYGAVEGTVAFPPGSTNQSILVPVYGDLLYEVQERFLVRLSDPVNAWIGDGEAKCSIFDEENFPTVLVDNARVEEGDAGTITEALVTVRLSSPSSEEVTLTYYTADGTALAVSDYIADRGVLVYPMGVTQQVIAIRILGDRRPEPDEFFSVVVTNVIGAAVGKGIGTVTLHDDDDREVHSLIWSGIPSTQTLHKPFPVSLTAYDRLGGRVTAFSEPFSLSLLRSVRDTGPVGESNVWEFPFRTYFHDAHSQFLYLTNDLGGAGQITSLAVHIDSLPGQAMNRFRIRLKQGVNSQFLSQEWDSQGWTTVFSGDVLIGDSGWHRFRLDQPFNYDGIQALEVDFSFDNTSYSSDGLCFFVETADWRGRVFESDSAFGDPLDWSGLTPPAQLTNRVPEILFTIESPVVFSSSSPLSFTEGTWSAELTVMDVGANLLFRAVTAQDVLSPSNPFTVASSTIEPDRPQILSISFQGNDVVVRFRGTVERRYQLEAAEDLSSGRWRSVGPQVIATALDAVVIDSGSARQARRFYRVREQ